MSTARSSRRGTAASSTTSRRTAAARPGTGRTVRPTPADGAEPGTARRRKGGGNLGFYMVMVLVVLALIGVFSYGPVMRGYYLGRLDKAKGEEAITAADVFLEFVKKNPTNVRYAITTNRGPLEAQVYMAKEVGIFSALVDILDRPEPVLTTEQLLLVLKTAAELYTDDKNRNDRLPSGLGDWATKNENRDIAIAAMSLAAKSCKADETRLRTTAGWLTSIARAPGQDSVRAAAALDGLAEICIGANLGYAIDLLATNASDQVVSHEGLKHTIINNASADHLPRLLPLLSNPLPGVRAVALEALGGPAMNLSDKPENAKRRQELGGQITAKLTAETPAVELAAALKATRNLRLTGAADAVLKLVPLAEGLALPGIDNKFFSDTLGKALIFSTPDEARTASEELINKLITALDDDKSRAVAADALALIGDPAFLSLRTALDKLAAHGDDPACFATLTTLVGKTYQRTDVVKANGTDPKTWQDFLAKDRPRFDQFREIYEWHQKNQQFQRVSDGRALLGKNKEYIATATDALNGWLEDKAFVAPLGLTKDRIKNLTNDMQMLGMSVRKAWSGALE